MKWEILKGSEKDFDGAPKFATVKLAPATGGTVFAEGAYVGARRTGFYGRTDMNIVALHEYNVIAERRPITEPDVNQQVTTEWSGEGLPPVGVECEMQNDECKWIPVDIIAHKDGFAFGWSYDYRLVFFSDAVFEFRPIRSAEDVARDKAFAELEDLEKAMPDGYQPYELLDAIVLAGYRKVE